MQISEKWLYEWVEPALNREELIKQLTLAGHEVASCQPAAEHFNDVFIGQILEIHPVEGSKKLQCCKIALGNNQFVQIVTGAANVREGMKIPVALSGANLPRGKSIQETELRGVKSSGMLCSLAELGLAESSEGIWELAKEASIGQNIWDYLQLDDYVWELELTPNRGDCLSVQGLAREISALNNIPLKSPHLLAQKNFQKSDLQFSVTINSPADCPRYMGRMIENINPLAETPVWLKEKLRRSGIRSIHPVVDIMNYVMLDLGQPLHAFDLDKLENEIIVRYAHPGESLALLDGRTVALESDVLVIADKKQAHAIAGVMGGSDSAVSVNTKSVFIESAFFSPTAISGKARRYGLHTDASHRFERGVDPNLPSKAIELATSLLVEIVGGRVSDVIDKSSLTHLPVNSSITLHYSRIEQILGITLSEETIENILRRLNIAATKVSNGWQVSPPSYRFDLNQEIDFIEEVARIHGYHHIPAQPNLLPLQAVTYSESKTSISRLRTVLVDQGYREVITYSFISEQWQKWFDPAHNSLALSNPLSAEYSVMRTQLWAGLLQTVKYNFYRQQTYLRLFETGLCFIPFSDQLEQTPMLAGVLIGEAYPEQWGLPKRDVDFFDMKSDIEKLLSTTKKEKLFRFIADEHPALRPGQTARIMDGKHCVGWCGALHPELSIALDIDLPVYLFSLSLKELQDSVIPQFHSITKFPAIRRDIAMFVDKTLAVDTIKDLINSLESDLLTNLHIFDVYEGKNVPEGKKSLALGLHFQANDRTLMEEEINQLVNKIVNSLKEELSVIIRE